MPLALRFGVVALAVAIITNLGACAFVAAICVFALALQPAGFSRSGGDDPIGRAIEEKWKID